MKVTSTILPGINAVWALDAAALPPTSAAMAASRIPVPVFTELMPVPLASTPKAERKAVRDGASCYEEASLWLETAPDFELPPDPAFVVRTVRGETFLLGSSAGSRPTVEQTMTTGTPGGDRAVLTVQAKHKDRAALVPCHIYSTT